MTVLSFEQTNNKGLGLKMTKVFTLVFLEKSEVNEMSKIKEMVIFYMSKEKKTLNTVSYKRHKGSSQSVLLNFWASGHFGANEATAAHSAAKPVTPHAALTLAMRMQTQQQVNRWRLLSKSEQQRPSCTACS